ncbi:membrane-bound acid phosphatase 2 [Novymonas esmeraldas]|uniref:Membrane-bound acid phosphatase 2 n=1 Tax=Novymonas esmeraldas TaxID=1808958 RepID=A0AAW0F429_9TRYP
MARLNQLALRTTLIAVLIAACVVTVSLAQSNSESAAPDILDVLQIHVLHRHGARSGQPRDNASKICTESPCGYLSPAGIQMLLNVGAFLRSRYNTDATVVSAPLFESLKYNLDVSYSRSTDVLRTLQSAEALLRGFFPDTDSLYPAIHTVEESKDVLLNSNTQPWLKFFYSNNKPLLHAVCNLLTDELFSDWTELTRIGAQIYLEGYCSVYETRSDCARTLFDVGAAKKAVGQLDQYPLLQANYEKLKRISTVLFDYEYHYNQSDPLMFKQGGRGQPFVQQMAKNMEDVMAGSNKFKLMHYSAHDTTLGPIWGTLGDRTPDGMMPPFAQALVAELLQNKTTKAYYVRILRGRPGQSPDTNYAFEWDAAWQMRCIDAANNMYNATGNICPFADFKRLVRWSEPGDVRGYCYLDQQSIDIANCPTERVIYGTPSSVLVPSTCQFYRAACPKFACEPGATLNIVSMQCVCSTRDCIGNDAPPGGPGTGGAGESKPTHRGSSGLSKGAVAGVSIATFCVGAIIAAAATAALCMCARRRRARSVDRLSSDAYGKGAPAAERDEPMRDVVHRI